MEKLQFEIEISAKLCTRSTQITGYFFLDNELLGKYSFDTSGNHIFAGEYELEEGQHRIGFTLNNKTSVDTIVDESGNIIDDTLITLEKIQIDGIDVTDLFIKTGTFINSENIQIPVIRNIGINGSYGMDFDIPYYEWLLSKV